MNIPIFGLVIVTFAATAANAADCSSSIPTIKPGKLTVAAYDYPPFTKATPDGVIAGIDPSIVARFAKDSCLELVPLVVDPAATIQAVVSGKADVAIGSWYRTEARARAVGQSDPIYIDSMALYSRTGYESLADVVGLNVGTVQGYYWVSELQKFIGPALKLYPSPLAMAQDLQTGRLDVAITGYNAGIYVQAHTEGYEGIQIKRAKPEQRVESSLEPAQTSILYTKSNESLGKALNASIAEQRSDGSIVQSLKAAGFGASIADVGEARLAK